MKDLFSGALGKTSKLLRSQCAATPNTKLVTQYEKFCDITPGMEPVACSLNGMLWLYRDSDNFYAVLYQWDAATKTVIQNIAQFTFPVIREGFEDCAYPERVFDEPVIRGIDWILTKSYIIQGNAETGDLYHSKLFPTSINTQLIKVADPPPPVSYPIANWLAHYADNRDNLICNIINGRIVGAGYTLYLKNTVVSTAWKETRLFFLSNGLKTHIPKNHPAEWDTPFCYSLLPSIGDWIMIEDFLIRRPNTPLSQIPEALLSSDVLLEARAIMPIEFNYYPNADITEQSFCSFNSAQWFTPWECMQVAAGAHELYARGAMCMGRAYILPASFGANGRVEEFYLYIQDTWGCHSPYDIFDESTLTLDANMDWLNLSLTVLRDPKTGKNEVVAFTRDEQSPLTSPACHKALQGDILIPKTSSTVKIPSDSELYFDAVTQSGLILSPEGASFLTWDSTNKTVAAHDYKCSTLKKWLSPSGRVDSVSSEGVLSADDGGITATDIKNHFFRSRLFSGDEYKPMIPATWADDRLSLAAKSDAVYMQKINSDGFLPTSHIEWGDVFRQAITLVFLRNSNGYLSMPEGWLALSVSDTDEIFDRTGCPGVAFSYIYGCSDIKLSTKASNPDSRERRTENSAFFRLIFQETSSLMPFTVKLCNLGFNEDFNHCYPDAAVNQCFCGEPIINWRGQRKYLKNRFNITITWYDANRNYFDHEYIELQIDLHPEIFDFDAEVLRSRRR